jgi:hypothetical protein
MLVVRQTVFPTAKQRMNLADAIDVLVLTIHVPVSNMQMRSRFIDFNFRTTIPQ